jgi:hypothetical protein
MSQRMELLKRFRSVCEMRRCDVLRYGAESVFIQFGPVVVVDRFVLLFAVVTNEKGDVRALDFLVDGDGPPHMTVGAIAQGGGWVDTLHSGFVRWNLAGPPAAVEGLTTLAWSHDVVDTIDMTVIVEGLSNHPRLERAARGPVPAQVVFVEHDRFVVVGGEALEIYRFVQEQVATHARYSIGLAPVPSLVPGLGRPSRLICLAGYFWHFFEIGFFGGVLLRWF